MKPCSTCGVKKPYSEFNKRKESKDGHTPHCKDCISYRRKELRDGGGTSSLPPELTVDQKKHVYTAVIMRMREQGLASSTTVKEMLDRVGAL